MKKLQDKTAIITGGNAGIGRIIALRFAEEGAAVAILARRKTEGEKTAADIRQAGGQAHFFHCDITDAKMAEKATQEAVARLEGLDILVNNAGGTTYYKSFPEESPEEWCATIALNLNGPFFMCRAAWPCLQAQGGGAIVNISSISAVSGIGRDQLQVMGGQPPCAYSAGKGGLEALGMYLAGVGGADKIRVNSIRPGRILTDEFREMLGEEGIFWPFYSQVQMLKRHGQPEDIAAAALFLASEEASFITGKVLDVDGGAALQL